MSRWVLGIDPGCPGALALLDPSGAVRRLQHGPKREQAASGTGRNRSEVDAPALHALLCQLRAELRFEGAPHVAAIELVHAMPTDGAVQAFSFGCSVQAWRQAAEVEGWPIVLVTPQSWQRHVPGISGTGKARKLSYHAAALDRWPEQRGVLVGPRDGARLDPAAALWIAEFARVSV